MKKILLCLLFFIFKTTFGQTISINEIDKFTGEKILQVNSGPKAHFRAIDAINESRYNTERLYFSIRNKHLSGIDKIHLQFNINKQAIQQITCFNEDSKVILLFEDGSKYTLTCANQLDCSTSIIARFNISKDEVQEMSKKILSSIRFYSTDGYFDYEIMKKKQETIKNTFLLLLDKI